MSIQLSVLDQSPRRIHGTFRDCLWESARLLKLCDKLGYRRFWFAEHHSNPLYLGSNPEITLALLSQGTHGIRLGSGGIMMRNYSPHKIVEVFSALNTALSGRVDLGMGKGAGCHTDYALKLNPSMAEATVPDKLKEVEALFNSSDLTSLIPGALKPPRYHLVGHMKGAQLAGELGAGMAVAHYHSDYVLRDLIKTYRKHFRASMEREDPEVIVSVHVISGRDQVELWRNLIASHCYPLIFKSSGPFSYFPGFMEAARVHIKESDRSLINNEARRRVVGLPQDVAKQIANLAEDLAVREFMILCIGHDEEARRSTYEELAGLFGLTERRGKDSAVMEG